VALGLDTLQGRAISSSRLFDALRSREVRMGPNRGGAGHLAFAVSCGSKCERLVESRSFPLCLSKQTLATLARASRSRQLRKAPVEAHEVLAGQVVDPTERIELLEIAQGYFQVADHIAAAALRATEPDSIPDAE